MAIERQTFMAKTIRKFLSGADYEKFLEQYNANTGMYKQATPANDHDFAVLEAYRGGETRIKKLADQFDVQPSSILTSLRKAALAKI